MIDSHCHLDCIDLEQFDGNLDNVILAATTAGVTHMLCVSIDLDAWPRMCELTNAYDNVRVTVGVHPNEVLDQEPSVQDLVLLARGNERVIGIGETGLDYFRTQASSKWQQARFRVHIEAALELDVPLVIHSRDAFDDTMAIAAEYPDLRAIMHCFTGDVDIARRCLDLGMYISFSGIVTFKNAEHLHAAAQFVPLDRMLIETDSPYLAPVPMRGKLNHPALVAHVAARIANLREAALDSVISSTSNNFKELFGWPVG